MYEKFTSTLQSEDILSSLITEEDLIPHIEARKDHFKSILNENYLDDPFNIDPSKLLIFIDPLDGTSDFVSKRPKNVTCLIGVTYEGRSKFGVVH